MNIDIINNKRKRNFSIEDDEDIFSLSKISKVLNNDDKKSCTKRIENENNLNENSISYFKIKLEETNKKLDNISYKIDKLSEIIFNLVNSEKVENKLNNDCSYIV